MSSLHVIICSNLEKSNGGCEIWLDYFLKRIITLSIYNKIYLYHVKAERNRAEELADQGIKSIDCARFNNGILQVLVFSIVSVLNMIKNEKSGDDVLLIGSTFVSLVGLMLWGYKTLLFKNVKIITWIRSIAVQELSMRSPYIARFAKFLEYAILRVSDRVITNGDDTFEYYVNQYNIKEKAFVIENAVPNDELFSIIDIDKNKEYVDIAYMGRYSDAKGFSDYLESIRRFKQLNELANIRFHCYGHGPLSSLIDHDIVLDHGRYTPEAVPDILEQMDAVVFLNKSGVAAGVSHSLLETLAAGRCVVAWDNKIHNQVCDDRTSYLVPENDINRLIKVYEEMCNNKKVLLDKGSNARLCAADFSVFRHVKKYIKYIRAFL